MHSPNIRYLPEIDHLRAFAALLIVFYHGQYLIGSKLAFDKPFTQEQWAYSSNPLEAFLLEGHTAVALFLVLSGFIFTYGAYGKRIDYSAFITNRLLRIYPLYLLIIIAGLAFYPQKFSVLALFATVLPFANMTPLDLGPMSAMFWAISVEFQCYLVFPLILAFVRVDEAKKFGLIIAMAVAMRLLGVLIGANARDLSYYHLLGRIDQFILGMLAAITLARYKDKKQFRILFPFAVLLVIAVVYGFHRLGGWPSVAAWKIFWPTVEGAIWAFLVVAYVGAGGRFPRWFSTPIGKIGEISFSIYLLHFPIIHGVVNRDLLIRITGHPARDAALNTLLVVVPLTTMLSLLTFHLIERPFLELRRKYLLS